MGAILGLCVLLNRSFYVYVNTISTNRIIFETHAKCKKQRAIVSDVLRHMDDVGSTSYYLYVCTDNAYFANLLLDKLRTMPVDKMPIYYVDCNDIRVFVRSQNKFSKL